ncbi:hypothetical protein ECDEC10E_5197 [Escherichia coli DEC10E]|nr:hypothetical protein ECDEC10E_5197 [Escherichia coli DEC10E]
MFRKIDKFFCSKKEVKNDMHVSVVVISTLHGDIKWWETL